MSVTDLDRRTIGDVIEYLRYGPDSVAATSRGRAIRTYAAGRVTYSLREREAYSYGSHFPLFRYVPRELSGHARDLFVINGDEWRQSGPSRTGAHQVATRERIALCADADSIVIPFSALGGAGIDIDSIRPVHVRADATWTETREVRTLEEVPRWARFVDAKREAATLEEVPKDYRETYRSPTDEELADAESRGETMHARYLPRLPDSDGRYRWTVHRGAARAPDPDGLYRWTEDLHRLGDALFSAVRAETFTRPADPFEHERDTKRETVTLSARVGDNGWRGSCETARDAGAGDAHEAGPDGACWHCGHELRASVTWRRRSRYLSSFDTNERPPLYFLAALPRGAGDTVETALDALAPRVVHAALARGREVRRQGDVFLIDTDLTRAQLAERGATFARLTQWTRDAKPRPGEVGHVPTLSAKDRRKRHARELRTARARWRETFGDALQRATYDAPREAARLAERERVSALWRELNERHERERGQLALDGFDALATLAPCDTCGAEHGAPCSRDVLDGAELNGRTLYPRGATADGYCRGDGIALGTAPERLTLGEVQRRERDALKREASRGDGTTRYLRPSTGRGERRQARIARERAASKVEELRRELRAETLSGPSTATREWDKRERARVERYAGPALERERRAHASRVTRARAALEDARARLRACELSGATASRDGYRQAFKAGPVALVAWRLARADAALRHRPSEVPGAAQHAERRERVRRAVAIYGTAHAATESATVRGAVYVRGTVRQVPDLDGARAGGARVDHAPLILTPDRWYLAVRNTVPRAATRRRRRTRRASDTRAS